MNGNVHAPVYAERDPRRIIDASPWGFLLAGLALSAAGGAAIGFPYLASLAVNVACGIALTLAGAITLVHTTFLATWRGRVPQALSGAALVVIGMLMLAYPSLGILGLTAVATAFFLVGGLLKLVLGLVLRPDGLWGWLTVNALASTAAGVAIVAGWPALGEAVVGLLIGLDLLFTGGWMLALAAALSRAQDDGVRRPVSRQRPVRLAGAAR